LAASGLPRQELRSLYWNLYRFQRGWDTGHTELAVMDRLLDAGYAYRFDWAEHPAPPVRPGWVGPQDGWVDRDGGFYQPPLFYCYAGSPLWERMVAVSGLAGLDAEPPEERDLAEVMLTVATLAEASGGHELIGMCYRLLWVDICFDEVRRATIGDSATIARLRAVVRRTGAMSIAIDYGMLRDPPADALAEDAALAWWFDLDA
jgi:hypothetical protein